MKKYLLLIVCSCIFVLSSFSQANNDNQLNANGFLAPNPPATPSTNYTSKFNFDVQNAYSSTPIPVGGVSIVYTLAPGYSFTSNIPVLQEYEDGLTAITTASPEWINWGNGVLSGDGSVATPYTLTFTNQNAIIKNTHTINTILQTSEKTAATQPATNTARYTIAFTSAAPGFVDNAGNTTGRVNTILPITLDDFSATKTNSNSALIVWTTAQEVNVDRFSIERSGGTKDDWTRIGTSSPTNTNTKHSYQMTDNAPLAGNNFYRLVSIDKDGKAGFSNIVGLDFGEGTFFAKLYPVPAKNLTTFRLGGDASTSYSVIISDTYGRQVKSFPNQKGGSVSSIDLSNLAAGTYTLLVRDINGTRVATQLFSKQD